MIWIGEKRVKGSEGEKIHRIWEKTQRVQGMRVEETSVPWSFRVKKDSERNWECSHLFSFYVHPPLPQPLFFSPHTPNPLCILPPVVDEIRVEQGIMGRVVNRDVCISKM